MAVLSLPVHVFERQLTGKLTLKSPKPGAVPDPTETLTITTKPII